MHKALILKACKQLCPVVIAELEMNNIECHYVDTNIAAAKAILDNRFEFILCCADSPKEVLDSLHWLKTSTIIPTSTRLLSFSSGIEREHVKEALGMGVSEFYDVAKANYKDIFTRNETFYPSNILLVEDNQAVASVLIHALESRGHQVSHHKSATEAHNALLKDEFDLVVTDLLLEGKRTGHDLVNYLKRNQRLDNIPALVVTGYSEPSVIIDLLSMGVSDVSIKPIIPEEFLLRVEQILRTKYYREQLEQQTKQLQKLSLIDPLTGAYNRRFMGDILAQKINDLKRKKEPFGVTVIDIDDFKVLNDTQGHLMGDKGLKMMTELIQADIRNVDSLCRFGGEEFVLILSDCDETNALNKAESICKNIADKCDFTISLGLAIFDDNSVELELDTILQKADAAMYQAKNNGKNRVVLA